MIEVKHPESPLRWICKSTRAIAKELSVMWPDPSRPGTVGAIGRPRKGKIIRTATPSFGTSAPLRRCPTSSGYQEERTHRQLRSGPAARQDKGSHDFPTPDVPRASLRHDIGLGRHRSRHGSVCGRLHSRMVAPGRETLSGWNDTDHRRRRWEQRLAVALWKFELPQTSPGFGLSSWPFNGPLSTIFQRQPLESLRGLISCPACTDTLAPFVEIYSALRGNPTFGGTLLSLLQPLSGPSWSFVPLRGYRFLSFADNAQVFQASSISRIRCARSR